MNIKNLIRGRFGPFTLGTGPRGFTSLVATLCLFAQALTLPMLAQTGHGGGMGGGGMGGGGMGGGGMGGMCGGMMFPEPEINQNLAKLNHFRCSDQSYIVTFL